MDGHEQGRVSNFWHNTLTGRGRLLAVVAAGTFAVVPAVTFAATEGGSPMQAPACAVEVTSGNTPWSVAQEIGGPASDPRRVLDQLENTQGNNAVDLSNGILSLGESVHLDASLCQSALANHARVESGK